MGKFTGKTAIISGGSRDIGRAVCIKLASEGANVVINYHSNAEQAAETLKAIEKTGGKAIIAQADVTKPEEVDALVAEAVNAFGDQIHMLVNVAGGMVERRPLEAMDYDFFEYVMRLNMTSTFLLTKAVVPHMPKGSAIVNFASQAGRDGGGPGASAYGTSKGAVMTFTRAMAKELGPKGIRVNSLCPGMIATTFHDIFTKDEVRQNVANATPLRRQGIVHEPADAAAYLLSDEASFITGANVDINGGMYFS
ncbi:MAG: glucose 1-dehydrogenase [Sphingomonadales bacterium]|nr:glucose 1-dehydrogenase [Sphingomonadales bacterium]